MEVREGWRQIAGRGGRRAKAGEGAGHPGGGEEMGRRPPTERDWRPRKKARPPGKRGGHGSSREGDVSLVGDEQGLGDGEEWRALLLEEEGSWFSTEEIVNKG